MGVVVIVLFMFISVLCFLEERLSEKNKKLLYVIIAAILVLLAGFREVGIDPDSENYEYAFHHYYDDRLTTAIEYSYFIISAILSTMFSDVHALFLVYAIGGVVLKFIAFRKLSELWFAPVLVYISFFYELHECTQIRTGVMSGLFMLAIPYLAERQRIKALLPILLGVFFHMSALILLPFLFLGNDKLSKKQMLFWIISIPCAYLVYISGTNILVNIPIAYVENKLTNYQGNADVIDVSVIVFSPLHFFTVLIFLYLMFFQETIIKYNKYFPIMMKIFALGLFVYVAFAFLPVLSQRLSYLFRIVTIILFMNVYYTIRQKWIGMLLVVFISFVYLNYALPYISAHLLWQG